jgi:hypothetical protein
MKKLYLKNSSLTKLNWKAAQFHIYFIHRITHICQIFKFTLIHAHTQATAARLLSSVQCLFTSLFFHIISRNFSLTVSELQTLRRLNPHCLPLTFTSGIFKVWKPSDNYMSSALTISKSSFCICGLRVIFNINQVIFVIEKCCVFFAVWTKFLNITHELQLRRFNAI